MRTSSSRKLSRCNTQAIWNLDWSNLVRDQTLFVVRHTRPTTLQREAVRVACSSTRSLAAASQVFERIRGNSNLKELRAEAAQLQRVCAAMRATLHEHVKAEEQELWPLFAENFTVEEQEDIVGIIIGRTGAEVLQAMLPWISGEQATRLFFRHLR